MFGRTAILVILVAIAAFSANIRLFLKDGTHQLVREYKVVEDRVRYYSIERSEWEEIPLELIDLKKTEAEVEFRQQSDAKERKALDEEEKAEREVRREIASVPMENGVFWVASAQKLEPLKQAEANIVNNKKRSILKAITPIPIVAGKSTVELDGTSSAFSVTGDRPEFYIRLSDPERFVIVKLTPTKASRIVQRWSIIPVTKELIEEMDTVDVFRRQVADGLYKIWSQKPMEPGEYAVIQYTEGKGNVQVWDFRLTSATPR